MKRIVALAVVAAVAATIPAGAEARSRPEVLCGNFGGQTMAPHLARKPGRCEVTSLEPGLPTVDALAHMKWTTWNKHPVGRGLVNGTPHRVRLKKTHPCGPDGKFKVYSQMSIDDRPFRSILFCGD